MPLSRICLNLIFSGWFLRIVHKKTFLSSFSPGYNEAGVPVPAAGCIRLTIVINRRERKSILGTTVSNTHPWTLILALLWALWQSWLDHLVQQSFSWLGLRSKDFHSKSDNLLSMFGCQFCWWSLKHKRNSKTSTWNRKGSFGHRKVATLTGFFWISRQRRQVDVQSWWKDADAVGCFLICDRKVRKCNLESNYICELVRKSLFFHYKESNLTDHSVVRVLPTEQKCVCSYKIKANSNLYMWSIFLRPRNVILPSGTSGLGDLRSEVETQEWKVNKVTIVCYLCYKFLSSRAHSIQKVHTVVSGHLQVGWGKFPVTMLGVTSWGHLEWCTENHINQNLPSPQWERNSLPTGEMLRLTKAFCNDGGKRL